MQPLISPVDHESRNNSYRAQDDDAQTPSENTPLIHRFPAASIPRQRGPVTTAVVGFLLLILLTGVIIGIYLLVIQDSEENILPPVESPLMLVFRWQWDKNQTTALNSPWDKNKTNKLQLRSSPPSGHEYSMLQPKARSLLITQTETRECNSQKTCIPLLYEMKLSMGELPYNFLVSSNGDAYEAQGFTLPSYSDTLVLALIGNFTKSPPARAQTEAVELFSRLAVNQQRLDSTFVIHGDDTKTPKYIYQSLRSNPQWRDKSATK